MTEGGPQYQTKSAYAAAMLRQAFAEGKYVAGDRLQIAKIAKDYSLSLTPVREALFELANEGLVDMEPHRGARVADLPMTDLADAYLARELLESAATRLAAQRATPEQVQSLVAHHDLFVRAVNAGERESLRRLSDQFHGTIYEMAQAPLLRRLIRLAWTAAPADTFTLIEQRAGRSVTDHEAIVEAIRSGSAERAEEQMRDHIRGSLELIRRAKAEGASASSGSSEAPPVTQAVRRTNHQVSPAAVVRDMDESPQTGRQRDPR